MTKRPTKIPDIAYSVEDDLIEIQQSTGCGEFAIVELHKIHLQLLAEKMGLIEPDNTAHMGKVVKAELSELLDAIGEHWDYLANDKHVDVEHIIKARTVYEKANSICRMVGLDSAILSGFQGNGVDDSVASNPPASEVKQAEQGTLV